METNKIILNEQKLRQIITEELEVFLITEGFLSDLKEKASKLKIHFNSIILASLMFGAAPEGPIAQAQSELSNNQQTDQFFSIVEQQSNKLQSIGLTEDAANSIISKLLTGAKETKEQELEIQIDLSDEEKAQQILDYQKQQIAKLSDIEIVKNILLSNFQKDIQQQGRTAIVGAAIKGGRLGSPSDIDSFLTGLGYKTQETLVATDDESFVKLIPSTTKKGQNLKFNYMDLDTYWNNLIVDNSKIYKEMRKEADIVLPYHYYDTGGGAFMQSHIGSQLQKENKIVKLKNRLNEIRGLYV